ncbi:glycosyltransferase family 4 protein [Oceanimonas smirnovii]|uniref:glycosyltransferase family 4 protein n=1 Tax=Oceanimonas smirnovii TaxID=264574 RepID=UPI003FD5FE26
MSQKKLLELCLSPDLGGLEIYMQKCSENLAKNFDVTAVVSEKSRLSERLNCKRIKKIQLRRGNKFSLITAYQLAKVIDKNKIDIIHCHWTNDLPIAVLAKKISKRKPKLIQSRHMTMTRFKNDPAHRFIYKNINYIICVTNAVERQIKKFIPSDIVPETSVLYPGADIVEPITRSERAILRNDTHGNEQFIVGIVGRITPDKGQYLLIEATKKLVEEDIPVKAIIVGHAMADSYLLDLKEKTKSLSIENNVLFHDFTNSPEKFMQSCDVMVTASKQETFGLVTVEAMQCGVAVIAANSGGTLEIIDDNLTGLLFNNEDSADLALKIKELYVDDGKRKRLSDNGKRKAQTMFENKKHFFDLGELIKKIQA